MESEVKPYSLGALGDELKGQGLELAEDGAEKAYVAVKLWLEKSAAATKTNIDDMVVGFLPQLDKLVMPAIDKIDGEVG